MQFENGMFILSVDVDVGDKKLGLMNRGKNDQNISKYFGEYGVGRIEEMALPLFAKLFDDFEIPATFAIRGQLADVDDSIFQLLLNSSVKHDIGAHGYSHKQFKNMSRDEAENELSMVSVVMKKVGVTPKSFVFPGNSVAYLNLLEKYGYKCYRSCGGSTLDSMCIEKHGQLYDIHPSLCLDQSMSSLFLNRVLDIAIEKKLPFHAWFHAWEFGETRDLMQRRINKVFLQLLEHVKKREKSGALTVETMYSATKKAEKQLERVA